MPKFDWFKEHPAWKLAAWALMLTPAIITAAGYLISQLR